MLTVLFSSIAIASVYNFDEKQKAFKEFIKLKHPRIKHKNLVDIIESVEKISKIYSIPDIILIGIISVESNFRIRATSYVNGRPLAYGLVQIHKRVWVDKKHNMNLVTNKIIRSWRDLYSVYNNIKAGAFILKEKIRICKTWKNRNDLDERGYDNIQECMISMYNGTKEKKYYKKVTSAIGEIFLIRYKRSGVLR